jgi:5'-3' exonuclease
MGITSFFPWFRQTFSRYVTYLNKSEQLENIDNLLIDMNGLLHPVAQKVFGYGKYTKPLLLNKDYIPSYEEMVQLFFVEVGKEVDKVVSLVPPNKRLILCIDGVAPVAKQIQQRQRRYKSVPVENFDPNSLTPGSELMSQLGIYLQEQYINKFVNDIEVIYSSADVPGEGEMKLVSFIRYYSQSNETHAIYGLDADIILLSLCVLTEYNKIFVVREREMDHAVINVHSVRSNIIDKLRWKINFSTNDVVYDFVFMCFFVGNDFLKRLPGVDIITGSIDKFLDVYVKVCSRHGHLTKNKKIDKHVLQIFLQELGKHEDEFFSKKLESLSQYISDPLFEKHVIGKTFDLSGYKKEYYEVKLNNTPIDIVCNEYIEGLEWVFSYYTAGVPSWKWYYPYNYSPFISDVANHVSKYKSVYYGRTVPYEPLYQLLLVIPPRSMSLLPSPLNTLYEKYPELFPVNVEIDASGKRNAYEAEVILPAINDPKLYNEFLNIIKDEELNMYSSINKSISVFRNNVQAIEL